MTRSGACSMGISWRIWLLLFFLSPLFLTPMALTPLARTEEVVKPWPFDVPQSVRVPDATTAMAVSNEIDAFVGAKLAAHDLKAFPPADPRTLLRRIYFDLIGLPPTPAEMDAFLENPDPSSYEKVVDQLLEDARYGERWARRWLDLARYADTAGYEGDPDLPYVWRYRDYVIDSFNRDKPYDLFIKEQLAGDEFDEVMGAGDLPTTPAERVVALTFLRLAPFTEPRGDETRHELLSEMTSTVGSVFLGLTIGCAKCHDHKYDDIPTRDFYRLKAFFATVSIPRPEPGDGFQIGGPLSAPFFRAGESEWVAERRAQFEQEIISSKQELATLRKQLEDKLGGQAGFGLQAMGGPLGNDYLFEETSVNDGRAHWSVVNCDSQRWEFFTDGFGPRELGSNAGSNAGKWFGDLPAAKFVSLGQYTDGKGGANATAYHTGSFSDILIYDHPLSVQERQAMAVYAAAKFRRDDVSRRALSELKPPQAGLQFWLNADDLDADPTTKNPPLGAGVETWTDLVSKSSLTNGAADQQPQLGKLGSAGGSAVVFDNNFLTGVLNGAAISRSQQGAIVALYSAQHTHEGYGFAIGGQGSFFSTFINPTASKNNLQAIIDDDQNELISVEDRQRFRMLSSREGFLRQQIKRLSPVAMSLRHSYGPPYEPGVPTSRVMVRGEYDHPGEVVEPGFPSCITGNQEPAAIRLDPFKRWPARSRRMALAQWIASPKNPLTARVMVNRLWAWHFGRGIVATPSDFGELRDGPSHRELLDWLAMRFIEEKWSLKAMHRLIVTSNTYRQASMGDSESQVVEDPGNRLLWRQNRRRLDAEMIRDTVLAVSGRLNPEQFGLPIFPPLPDDIGQRVKYSQSKWYTQYGEEGRKRSIYIYQQRTLTMPFLQAFDALVCEESRPLRRTSTTPLQSLAMYNGEFVNEEARYFAARVTKTAGGQLADQINNAFLIAFGRPASEEEKSRLLDLVENSQSEEEKLVGLCRVILNSNELIYVD